MSPNKLIFGHSLNNPMVYISNKIPTDIEKTREVNRQEAQRAIDLANIDAKLQFNKKHTPLALKVGQKAFIKLHSGYNVEGISKKLGQQRVGPFKITKRMGQLAYKLDIPETWRIHPVILVTMLKPAPEGEDPYNRQAPKPRPVEDEYQDTEFPSWEIEAIVAKRVRKYGRGSRTEYKVR